jgi:hypothetical protein
MEFFIILHMRNFCIVIDKIIIFYVSEFPNLSVVR